MYLVNCCLSLFLHTSTQASKVMPGPRGPAPAGPAFIKIDNGGGGGAVGGGGGRNPNQNAQGGGGQLPRQQGQGQGQGQQQFPRQQGPGQGQQQFPPQVMKSQKKPLKKATGILDIKHSRDKSPEICYEELVTYEVVTLRKADPISGKTPSWGRTVYVKESLPQKDMYACAFNIA